MVAFETLLDVPGVCHGGREDQHAASIAGHLKLGKLIVFWDDNEITIDGRTDLSFSEDVLGRFASYGWHTESVDDGEDLAAIIAAAEAAAAGGSVADKSGDLGDITAQRTYLETVVAEVGDVDITKSDILVSVGRGIEDEDNLARHDSVVLDACGRIDRDRPDRSPRRD